METSLVVPARNEQYRLPETLDNYGEAMNQRFGEEFEIMARYWSPVHYLSCLAKSNPLHLAVYG